MSCLGVFALSWVTGYVICRAVLGRSWRDVPVTLRLGLGWAAGAAFSGMTTFWAIVLTPGRRGEIVAAASVAAVSVSLLPSTRRHDGTTSDAGPVPWRRGERVAWWLGA